MTGATLLLAYCTAVLLICKGSSSSLDQPNILFILADDMGYHDAGFQGSSISTPNIDRLAQQGVILQSHYVMPQCSPTRASFMTGRDAIRLGTWFGNPRPTDKAGLALTERTIADMLTGYGYKTHAIGKWHLGMFSINHTPVLRGFESFLGMYLGSGDYFEHTNSGAYDFRYNSRQTGGRLTDVLLESLRGVYSTEVYTNRTLDLLEEHAQQAQQGHINPFFIYLAYQTPHGPFLAPKRWKEMYTAKSSSSKRRIYSAMISSMDHGIGQIMDRLEELNMINNTLIVFSSDNGGVMDGPGCNFPLRGGKQGFYEGGVRALTFVNSPLLNKTGYVNKNIHHVTDWFPTFEFLANGQREESEEKKNWKNRAVDGVNVWESISNGKMCRKSVLINIRRLDRYNTDDEIPEDELEYYTEVDEQFYSIDEEEEGQREDTEDNSSEEISNDTKRRSMAQDAFIEGFNEDGTETIDEDITPTDEVQEIRNKGQTNVVYSVNDSGIQETGEVPEEGTEVIDEDIDGTEVIDEDTTETRPEDDGSKSNTEDDNQSNIACPGDSCGNISGTEKEQNDDVNKENVSNENVDGTEVIDEEPEESFDEDALVSESDVTDEECSGDVCNQTDEENTFSQYTDITDGEESTADHDVNNIPDAVDHGSQNNEEAGAVDGNSLNTQSEESDCGKQYLATAEPGRITSPGYPNKYWNNVDSCVTTIYAGKGQLIQLSFQEFDVEYRSTCDYDYLEVRDGNSSSSPILGRFCGGSLPASVASSAGSMWMQFNSDIFLAKTGFLANFRSFDPNGITCDKPLIPGGTVSPSNATVSYGATYEVTCDTGIGAASTMTCGAGGNFTQTQTCEDIPTNNEDAAAQCTEEDCNNMTEDKNGTDPAKKAPFENLIVYRWHSWKLIVGNERALYQGWKARNSEKVIEFDKSVEDALDEEIVLLFELSSDPREKKNIADRYPGMVSIMQEKVSKYLNRLKNIRKPKTTDKGKKTGVWRPWLRRGDLNR